MLCVAMPLSDHELKLKMLLFSVCGLPAEIELAEPMITVLLNGVTPVVVLIPSVRPEGTEAKLSTAVFGSSRTLVVAERPPASVAVRSSSRYDGYSWSGALNEQLDTPAESCTWCVWQLLMSVGQWWMISDHVSLDAG